VTPAPFAVLSVVHAGGGGTILTNRDLMGQLARERPAFVLLCGAQKWTLHDARADFATVEEIKFARPWSAVQPLSDDRLGAVAHVIRATSADIVHIRSLLGSGPEIVSTANSSGAASVVSFHDFLSLCPTIQLLDAEDAYCAGECTAGPQDCPVPSKWFADIPRLKHAYVHEWRARMAENLASADAFVTTSETSAALLKQHFAFLRTAPVHIIAHGRDAEDFALASQPPGAREIRVVSIGAVGVAKGRRLITRLAKLCREHGDRLEFHALGVAASEWDDAEAITFHGAYERAALPGLLAEIGPSFALVAPIWPETYSHALSEAWMAGVPVVASDIGAVGERVRRHGGGWLADPHLPEAWREIMLAAARDPASWRAKVDEIAAMPARGVEDMARDYVEVYRTVLGQKRAAL
jgi:glycosyltransferase involved in cell wall biosynthesis